MTEPTQNEPTTPVDDAPIEPETGPGAYDPRTVGHEEHAGDDVPDPWQQDGTPAATQDRANAADNQTPEVTEFGARAVQSGDPDGEDRPNGDPRVVGQPVGGGDRSPEAPTTGDGTVEQDNA